MPTVEEALLMELLADEEAASDEEGILDDGENWEVLVMILTVDNHHRQFSCRH